MKTLNCRCWAQIVTLLLINALSLLGCTNTSATSSFASPLQNPVPTQPTATAVTASLWRSIVAEPYIMPSQSGINIIIEENSNVKIKRREWSHYASASFGTVVRKGDLLDINGEARIFCANLSIRTVSGHVGTPCPEQKPALQYKHFSIVSPRSTPLDVVFEEALINIGVDTSRNSILMTNDVDLWSSRVQVLWARLGPYTVQGAEDVFSISSSQETRYRLYVVPNDSIELGALTRLASIDEFDTSSGGYWVRVSHEENAAYQRLTRNYLSIAEARNVSSLYMLDSNDTLEFRTPSELRLWSFNNFSLPEEQLEPELAQALIMQLPLEESTRRFLLAVFYLSRNSTEPAIKILEDLTDSKFAEKSVVQRWFGDALINAGEVGRAELVYRSALTVSEISNDTETAVLAHRALWYITNDCHHLAQAISIFQQLGDDVMLQSLTADSTNQGNC